MAHGAALISVSAGHRSCKTTDTCMANWQSNVFVFKSVFWEENARFSNFHQICRRSAIWNVIKYARGPRHCQVASPANRKYICRCVIDFGYYTWLFTINSCWMKRRIISSTEMSWDVNFENDCLTLHFQPQGEFYCDIALHVPSEWLSYFVVDHDF